MSPKSGRCPNAGTNVPWEVMEHVDCIVMTDRPGAGTGSALNASAGEARRVSMVWRPLWQSGQV